jgi:hypothetical protein
MLKELPGPLRQPWHVLDSVFLAHSLGDCEVVTANSGLAVQPPSCSAPTSIRTALCREVNSDWWNCVQGHQGLRTPGMCLLSFREEPHVPAEWGGDVHTSAGKAEATWT